MKNETNEKHWILWDGDCGFCRRSIKWIMRHDHKHRLHAIAYQDAPSPPMTPQLREACQSAVHVVTPDGRMILAGRAFLFILQQIGHRRLARTLAQKPFIWFIELGYSIVARNRQFFSKVFFRSEG